MEPIREAPAAPESAIEDRLETLETALADLAGSLEAIESRVRDTQALVARTYEAQAQWDELWEQLRATPEYAASYEPEPLVTVITPTYNRADELCVRPLPSLLAQTYQHWEAIVVGDHCTDDTGERIAELGDHRLRWVNLPERGPYPDDPTHFLQVAGIWPVRRALELAQGAWIARLDDDDEWDPDHLETLVGEAVRTKAELVYAKWRQRDARDGALIDYEFGEWPLAFERFAFQSAIFHQLLRHLPPDPNCRFAGEAGDWNGVRRWWEAGVKFAFVERPLSTIWFMPRDGVAASRFDWARDTF